MENLDFRMPCKAYRIQSLWFQNQIDSFKWMAMVTSQYIWDIPDLKKMIMQIKHLYVIWRTSSTISSEETHSLSDLLLRWMRIGEWMKYVLKTRIGKISSYEPAVAKREMCPRLLGNLLLSPDAFGWHLQVLHVPLSLWEK